MIAMVLEWSTTPDSKWCNLASKCSENLDQQWNMRMEDLVLSSLRSIVALGNGLGHLLVGHHTCDIKVA